MPLVAAETKLVSIHAPPTPSTALSTIRLQLPIPGAELGGGMTGGLRGHWKANDG